MHQTKTAFNKAIVAKLAFAQRFSLLGLFVSTDEMKERLYVYIYIRTKWRRISIIVPLTLPRLSHTPWSLF